MYQLNLQSWINYLGHYHPLIVHLPIGILLLVIILELLQWKRRQTTMRSAIQVALGVAFFSSILSCILGYFLSTEGGYERTTLLLHQWMGIGLALITGLSWWLQRGTHRKWYRLTLFLIFILLMITGHQGGNMTHGADYLTANLPSPLNRLFGQDNPPDTPYTRPVIENITEAVVFTDLVVPILQAKCYSCHSSAKIKGGLRLDEAKYLFKGGKHGEIIEAGKPENSEFIKRLLLPMEDDKRMAPKDQPQLTKSEITLLSWWVKSGADIKKKVGALQPDSLTYKLLESFTGNAADSQTSSIPLSAVFAKTVPQPDSASIAALRALSVLVTPIAQNSPFLLVSCVNFKEFSDKHSSLLLPLKENIAWLQLDNTAITDEGLKVIAQFPHLVRLHLNGTNTGNAGIQLLSTSAFLEYLNVNQTKLDNRGLASLSTAVQLRQLYCWNTAITMAGVETLRQKRPDLSIFSGLPE